MRKYSEYKDSGVKWIGDIPKHWEVTRGKNILNLITERSQSEVKVGLENIEGFTGQYVETETKYDGEGVQVRVGDIVYGKLRPYLCKAWLATFECNAVGDFYVFRCKNNNYTRYIHQLFLSHGFTDITNASTYGARMPRVASSFIQSLSFPIPPLAEQRAIVSYLDGKVGQIDTFVAKQTQQIELLKELKQAVIANAVTKGMANYNNHHTKLKQSGVSWIGEIPEHWEVKRAKNMFIRMAREVRDEDAVITCFRDGQVTLRKNRRVDGFTESLKEIGYQGIRKGDLVIHQMDAFAGSIGVSDSDGKGTPVYICLQPKGDCSNNYYMYLLREMARTGFIKSLYRGIRERSSDFRYETFAKLFLPIPPLAEQRAIVSYIEAKTASINKLIDAYEQQVERIKEYKQRLISDAVTGKMNVTDEQTQTN